MLKKLSNLLCAAAALVALAASVAAAMPRTPSTEATPPVRSGTVIETMNAAGYTYLLVAEPGGQRWVAIPETTVTAGNPVSYYDGMVMNDFTSTSLARTFPAIVFSAGLVEQTATPVSAPTSSAAQNPDDSFAAAIRAELGTPSPAPLPEISGGSIAAVVPFTEVAIEKSPAANGYTVAEIFAQVDALAGEKVQIRGKVVKFSPMIMGRNWIHLQDGSGNPMQNTHDLVITSDATVEVDSIVTFEGILAANRDFGAGYTYQAIVESAAVVE
jgi:hypothetical protein